MKKKRKEAQRLKAEADKEAKRVAATVAQRKKRLRFNGPESSSPDEMDKLAFADALKAYREQVVRDKLIKHGLLYTYQAISYGELVAIGSLVLSGARQKELWNAGRYSKKTDHLRETPDPFDLRKYQAFSIIDGRERPSELSQRAQVQRKCGNFRPSVSRSRVNTLEKCATY